MNSSRSRLLSVVQLSVARSKLFGVLFLSILAGSLCFGATSANAARTFDYTATLSNSQGAMVMVQFDAGLDGGGNVRSSPLNAVIKEGALTYYIQGYSLNWNFRSEIGRPDFRMDTQVPITIEWVQNGAQRSTTGTAYLTLAASGGGFKGGIIANFWVPTGGTALLNSATVSVQPN